MSEIDGVLLVYLELIAVPVVVTVLGVWVTFFVSSGWKRWLVIGCTVINSLVVMFIISVMVDTYRSGCYGMPKIVEYHDGMTLCPGQTAIGSAVIRMHRKDDGI